MDANFGFGNKMSAVQKKDTCWFCMLDCTHRNIRKDLILAMRKCCEGLTCQHSIPRVMPPVASEAPSVVDISDECLGQRPLVYLDGLPEWSSNESFYVIGLSAWLLVKPFVSFFSHKFCLKMGTAVPCLIESPWVEKRLVWQVVASSPEVDEGASFGKTHKVWLKLPTSSDEPFKSLVHDSLGMHIFKTMCQAFSGRGVLGCGILKQENQSLRSMHGVECDKSAAAFFGNFSDSGLEAVLPSRPDGFSQPGSPKIPQRGENSHFDIFRVFTYNDEKTVLTVLRESKPLK